MLNSFFIFSNKRIVRLPKVQVFVSLTYRLCINSVLEILVFVNTDFFTHVVVRWSWIERWSFWCAICVRGSASLSSYLKWVDNLFKWEPSVCEQTYLLLCATGCSFTQTAQTRICNLDCLYFHLIPTSTGSGVCQLAWLRPTPESLKWRQQTSLLLSDLLAKCESLRSSSTIKSGQSPIPRISAKTSAKAGRQ